MVPLIKRMQKLIVEKQAALNLQEAESYLKTISHLPNLIEVEPAKVFYLTRKSGTGPPISNQPLLHFKMSELKNGELHLLYSTHEDKGIPFQVDLDAVVPGFIKGVQGMCSGKKEPFTYIQISPLV